MSFYTSKPKARRARQVWEYFTEVCGSEPLELWYNPNCWLTGPAIVGNMWGWWLARCRDIPDNYEFYDINGHEIVAYTTPSTVDEWLLSKKKGAK